MGMMQTALKTTESDLLSNPDLMSASEFLRAVEAQSDDNLRVNAIEAIRIRDSKNIIYGKTLGVQEQKANNKASVDQLIALMLSGEKKIEAIKEYRSLVGVGLKEAKDAVEDALAGRPSPSVPLPTSMPDAHSIELALRSIAGFAERGNTYDAVTTMVRQFGMNRDAAAEIFDSLAKAFHKVEEDRKSRETPKEYVVFRKDETESYMNQWIRTGHYKDEYGSEAKGDAIEEAKRMAARGVEDIIVAEIVGKTVPVFKEV